MSVTMKQIARQAGVSRSAVSAVVNNDFSKIRVGPARQRQIRSLIRRCHYRPNSAARILVTRKTHIINIVIPSAIFFQNYNLSTIVTGLQSVTEEHQYRIKLTSLSYGYKDYRTLDGSMADGMVLFYWGIDHDRVVREAQKLRLPLVVAYARCHLRRVPNLYYDTKTALYRMARHLLEAGHRQIAYAPVFPYDVFNSDGQSGVRQAVRECAGARLTEWTMPVIETSENNLHDLYRAGRGALRDLKEQGKVTAVLFNQDAVAFGALEEARQTGVRVPADLAVASCGNDPFSGYWHPSLTTVDLKPLEFGRRLGRMLFELLEKKKHPYRHQRFIPELIIRESTDGTAQALDPGADREPDTAARPKLAAIKG